MHGYVRGSFTQSLVTIAVQLPPKKSPNWLTKKFSWANAAQCSIYTPTHQMLHAAPTSVRKLIKLSLQHDWAVSHRFSHWRHVQRQATATATGNWQLATSTRRQQRQLPTAVITVATKVGHNKRMVALYNHRRRPRLRPCLPPRPRRRPRRTSVEQWRGMPNGQDAGSSCTLNQLTARQKCWKLDQQLGQVQGGC